MNKQQKLEKELAELEEQIKINEFAINQMKFRAIGILEELASIDKKYEKIAYEKSKEWKTIEPFSG